VKDNLQEARETKDGANRNADGSNVGAYSAVFGSLRDRNRIITKKPFFWSVF